MPGAGAGLHPLLARTVLFLARYERDHLDLEIRRAIYAFLQEYPGIHLSEIAREMEIGTNHAKYHLEYLEEHGLASSRKEDGYWRFYPKVEGELGKQEMLDRRDKDALSLLRREVPLHVTVLLLEHGELPQGEIAERVDVSASTLSYHLKKMADAGLVEGRKEGRRTLYHLVEEDRTAQLLMRYSPPDKLVSGFLDAWENLEL